MLYKIKIKIKMKKIMKIIMKMKVMRSNDDMMN